MKKFKNCPIKCPHPLLVKNILTLSICETCGETHNHVEISDSTVIKEFSTNYYLKKDMGCAYSEAGRFCVLARYSEFMNNLDKYIDTAYDKLKEPICDEVHWRDLR